MGHRHSNSAPFRNRNGPYVDLHVDIRGLAMPIFRLFFPGVITPLAQKRSKRDRCGKGEQYVQRLKWPWTNDAVQIILGAGSTRWQTKGSISLPVFTQSTGRYNYDLKPKLINISTRCSLTSMSTNAPYQDCSQSKAYGWAPMFVYQDLARSTSCWIRLPLLKHIFITYIL